MMNILSNSIKLLFGAAVFSITVAAYSQDILITNPSDDTSGQVIPFSANPHLNYGTDFGSVNLNGGSFSNFFVIKNIDTDTALLLGTIEVSGANPGDFTIIPPANNQVPPNSSTSFQIVFNPSAVGTRTATISVPSSDPDPGNPFLIKVSGSGVNGFPVAVPDFWISDTGIKAKHNKKTNMADIKGRLLVVNNSNVPVGPATINIYASSDQLLDDNDPLVGSVTTPDIKGYIDPAKPIKVKYKVSTDIFSGVLYFRITAGPGNLNDAFYGVTP